MPRREGKGLRVWLVGEDGDVIVRGTTDPTLALGIWVTADERGELEFEGPWDRGELYRVLRHDHEFEGEGLTKPYLVKELGDDLYLLAAGADTGWFRWNVSRDPEYSFYIARVDGPGRGNWRGVYFHG